jgi:putative ABC transport system permease protein
MFIRIITLQARHQWGIALLVFLAMVALVTLYVYSNNTTQFTNRSMEVVMKNMGHNLIIIPRPANPLSIYFCSDDQASFADETALQMSKALNLSSKYYVSVLQQRVDVNGQELLLTGIEPIARLDETPEKGNMILPLGKAEVRLGDESARKLKKQVGDSIKILGEEFRIVAILPPKAMLDDCRIYLNLAHGQELLAKEGQINYILAFLCLHGGSLERALKKQEGKLAKLFPDFRQISRMDIVKGRHLARVTTRKFLYYLLGIVAAVTVMVIAMSGLQEVAERKHETGIMIAMGVSHTYIVCLYLVKTLALALAASIVGFLLGSALAVHFTAPFLVVNTKPVAILWQQLPAVVMLTCTVAAIAEIAPVVNLLRLDPNTILAEQ